MHCHILPGIDDGPKTIEETEEVLRVAEKQGISCMICTPHFHPGRYMVEAPLIEEKLAEVRKLVREKHILVDLLPGQECFWYSELIDALKEGRVLTLNKTRYVLVEFMPWTIFGDIVDAVRSLTMAGYLPIIAHFERYECLQGRVDRLAELKSMGASLQLNFSRLADHDSFFRKNPWKKLVNDGYVDFLGSDTHGVKFRPLHVEVALTKGSSGMDMEMLDRILGQNVRKLKLK